MRYSVRDATPHDRRKLANLTHFEFYVHRHLDWRPALDWLGQEPYLVIDENDDRLLAALACPPDPLQVAWMRLFAVSGRIPVEEAWDALWNVARERLNSLPSRPAAAAIPLQQWFEQLLRGSGFRRTYQVIMLSWDVRNPPQEEPTIAVIRPMNRDDLPAVAEVDAAAFEDIWQTSQLCLGVAFSQAAIATVAEVDGRMAGYQISTATPVGGHLARLAVLPEYQRQGIGSALLRDLLSQFSRRGALKVTVNTQKNNKASLSLYEQVGFKSTGEEYPVYEYPLD